MTGSAEEQDGIGYRIGGALLAALQINLYVGFPLYLVIGWLREDIDLIPNTATEALVLVGCLTPVLLFVLWAAFSGAAEPHGDQGVGSGTFDGDLNNLAIALAASPGHLTDDQRRFREGLHAYQEAADAAADEMFDQVRHLTPDEAYRVTREETGDHGAADRVRFRVWEAQTRALDDEQFIGAAGDVEANEQMTIAYRKKMVVIDEERESAGSRSPSCRLHSRPTWSGHS